MKIAVKEISECPNCGKPMPAAAPAGLCPACLLAQGADSEPGEADAGGRFEPPRLEEVARLFPQLEILGLLGAGGMGAVYKARQPALDRIVALKILPTKGVSGARFEERFNREARALARLSHPNIVAVFEFGQVGGEGGPHFFIMEFVDGANLRQLEHAGRLSPREALQIVPQICDALQYAHDEGVVHRDIKPENVLVDRKGRVKIADFGLAKILGADAEALRLTAEGQVMGTPHYMAPEQVERPLAVDHRADIYSLGVVFYEMLTGDLPLGNFSPPSRKVQVDVRLDEVVLRALENDPSRRYQKASEVKTQVESIAGTPPETRAGPAPEQGVIRWAGFPLVVERDGARSVNRKEAFKAFGILFGVLTVAFGIVTLTHGQNLFGWLGIAGSTSLQMRLLFAALVTAFGVWRALHSKPAEEALPQTPQGTVILPPERFSRKAILGAVWMMFFIAAALMYFTLRKSISGESTAAPSTKWWQILLSFTVLPLGVAAPLGTTTLGWLAVRDIRRSVGRLSGLGLALFDGLLFPLLALDGLIYLAWVNGAFWIRQQLGADAALAWPQALVAGTALLVCALVDFLIVRRVWRTIGPAGNTQHTSADWWWNRKPGVVAIGVGCALVILAASQRREQPGIFKTAPAQVAVRDDASGALVANLPGGRRMELLAIGEGLAIPAPDEWWKPDGTRHLPARFEVQNIGRITTPNLWEKDFIFRFTNLREDALPPVIVCNPGSPFVTGGQVYRDGQPIDDARPLRFAWPEHVDKVTMRLGFGLVPWRPFSTYQPATSQTRGLRQGDDPNWLVDFHQAGERDGQAIITLVRGSEDSKWQTRIVAVDTNGVAHRETRGTSTRSQKSTTLTYTFPLPLASVQEFQLQIRPLHWVELRDVALSGHGVPRRNHTPAPVVTQVAAHDRAKGRLVTRLQPRGTVELLAISDDGAAPNAWWNPQGEAVPDTLYEVVSPERARDPDRINRQIILRLRDLPGGAAGPQLEMVDASGGSSGRAVLRDGKELAGGWIVNGSFPPDATQGTVRLGFGLAPWKTVSGHGADGGGNRRERVPGIPQMEVSLHQISEAGGEAQVTMLVGYPARDWQVQVVAVDTKGQEHVSASSRGSHAHEERVSVWSHKFWRLPLAQVKEFQVQVRPIEWIEFREIPLHPGDRSALGLSARKLVPTAWSAAKEVHITEYFDFDKGVSGVFPTAADGTKKYRGIERNPSWPRERGFDVEAGTNQLYMSQMFITDLTAAEWETLTIPQLEQRLNVYYGPPTLPSSPNATLPLTYGFRTVEGAMGMMQITAFDEGKAGVHLRYRLVERARFE